MWLKFYFLSFCLVYAQKLDYETEEIYLNCKIEGWVIFLLPIYVRL